MKKLKQLIGLFISKIQKKVFRLVVDAENEKIKTKLGFCGKNVCFNGTVTIVSPQNMIIYNNVHIGNNSFISAVGGVEIGENTHISRNLVIQSSSHNYLGTCIPYDDSHILKQVKIDRNVWIGTNVVIIPGVTIGEGAIVGAGTVVTKSIPPLSIVGNQPTRIIKYRNSKHYTELNSQGSFGGVCGKPLD